MQKEEDKLLVRIAEMYYQEDKNQSQIAKELNIHRSTISRLLKRSRNEGIVNIPSTMIKREPTVSKRNCRKNSIWKRQL